jgi:FkbM family methyltransferase
MSKLINKIHTVVDVASQPTFFLNYRRGIIPTTYCRLNQPWLKSYKFRTILDIGANIGRFAITANAVFPDATIHVFEPLPDCFLKVERNLRARSNMTLHNIALGAEEGEIEMFANEFTPSSSILPMANSHKEAFPFASNSKKVKIKVGRLDNVLPPMELQGPTFIKIDVQGYEREVIAGGRNTIGSASVVLVELSFEELYEGQPLFNEIYDSLRNLGFDFRGTMAQMSHPGDGRIIDSDCFFVRT